jgi:serine/threonine protein phosphatase PrpC
MKYLTASNSTIGLRKTNQDRYVEFNINGIKVMAVCDGNGGNGGEIIADHAVKTATGEILYGLSRIKKVTLKKLQYIGRKAIKKTAEDIKNLKFFSPGFANCGTTITLVFIHKSTVITLWVGDSPAMLYKGSEVEKLASPPHTLAEMLIAQGKSRESIEKQSGLSSTLTRCIGFKDTEPSINMTTCKPPFSVVIASDGIDYIPENKLEKIFNETHLTECLPGKIIISALEHGSSDNITVVATKVKQQAKRRKRRKEMIRRKRGGLRYV